MPKEEWGVKRLCPACSTRFYDLRRNPMTCPACGNVVSLEALLGNRSQSTVTRKAVVSPKPAAEPDSDVLIEDEDDSDDVIEDDLLADDDDDDNVDLDDITDVAADDDT